MEVTGNNNNTELVNTFANIINIVEILTAKIISLESNNILKLNENEVKFIKQMMNDNPDSFEKISTKINDIMVKRQIVVGDIPDLIYIISTIYIHDFEHKSINIIDCIQFTINTIIESGIIPIKETDAEILEGVVNSSLNLLKLNLPAIEKGAKNGVTIVVKIMRRVISGLKCGF